ncbi:hypothetical protein MTBSS4_10205 [Magnetospirillum sp. SS-4]|nr:hypothetical protein MTBSS4_10205 [Magnetospirillum sp. SS-4]
MLAAYTEGRGEASIRLELGWPVVSANREAMQALLRTSPEPTKKLVDLMAAPDIEA